MGEENIQLMNSYSFAQNRYIPVLSIKILYILLLKIDFLPF